MITQELVKIAACPLAASDTDSMTWVALTLGVVSLAYIVIRPMLKRKKDPLERMPSMSLAQQRTVEREMSNLLVELSEMTRQVSAQLDTRSAKLELLIEEADRKIGELKRLTATQRPSGDSLAEPSPPTPAPPDPRHEEVYALADAGCAAPEIAKRLGRPRGEIELILALRVR